MVRSKPTQPQSGRRPHPPILAGEEQRYNLRRVPKVLLDAVRAEAKRRKIPIQEMFHRVIAAGVKTLAKK